ncbi:MAG: hypothetical protein A2Y40_02985 [Candidatus Margulisbacteria bacterium GWF2_35_9]|nr:MAG: hypothetical protein A2Y40_02985 [Candidatus Margulisbacteria bacterium GWF2_35_9]
MKIDLTKLLSEIGLNESTEEKLQLEEELLEDISVSGEVEISLHLLNAGDRILANGQINATLNQICGVCLTPFKSKMTFNFEENIANELEEKSTNNKELELNVDDIFFTYNENKELDLTEFVRELVILNLPIAAKCDINCMVKSNTKTKVIDPRLKVLEKFKTED